MHQLSMPPGKAFEPDRSIAFDRFDSEQTSDLIHRMPKAELHLHIEGTLEPELMLALADRNQVKLAHADVDALRNAYQFENLQSFLDIYYAGASVLQTERDFYELAMAYYQRAAADGVIHAEIFFDPQTHTDRQVPIDVVITGLTAARDDARRTYGITGGLILCFLRHLGEPAAQQTLDAALPFCSELIGVGLDSSEQGYPPSGFTRVFERSATFGLLRVAHAGEEGPPDYIRQALTELHVARIDHGVRCVEDAALVQELSMRRTPLTICPLSNTRLKVYDDMAEHALPALLDAGLCVTVNSDDPAYFGGYLNANLDALFAAHPDMGARQAWQLAANSFEASFVEPTRRATWIDQLNKCFMTGKPGPRMSNPG